MYKRDYCLDRDEESQKLLLKMYDANSTIIEFVYANTAVGKTTFTDKLLTIADTSEVLPICIRTAPENKGTGYSSWEVFNDLVEEIDKLSGYADNSLISFDSYILHDSSVNEYIAKKYITKSLKAPKKTLQNIILLNMDRFGRLESRNQLLYDGSMREIAIKKNYLKYIFSSHKIFLVIDNIQNIDRSSLKILLEIISETSYKNHFILFEYTITNYSTKEDLEQLLKFIKTYDVQAETLQLKQIPREYIIDVVSNALDYVPNSYNYNREILNYYDQQKNGNLLQIISHASNQLQKNEVNDTNEDDEILKRILRLSEKSQLILSLVIYNNGKLRIEILEKLIPQDIEKGEIEVIYKELENEKFIYINENGYIIIRHATTIDSWRNSRDKKIKNVDVIVQRIYEQYYLKKLTCSSKNISDEFVANVPWLALMQIYKIKYPQKIYTLIDYMRKDVLTVVSPETAWIFLSSYIHETQKNFFQYKDCYYDILNLCFEFELYQEGYTCVEFMEKNMQLHDEPRLLFYKMLYLSALDKHEENIKIYEKYKDVFQIGSKERLNAMLIVLASYKSTNCINDCYVIYTHIKKNREYRKHIEFGYFLRLTCMYLPRRKALRYIRKSFNFFMKYNNFHQAGKSAITYAHLVSSLGNPKKAEAYILEAEKLLSDKQIGQHMFLVNKAVISMHQGNYGMHVWECLDIAELSARVSFDKLAIQLCKLVWCLENNKLDNCNVIINKILEYAEIEPDKAIVSVAYYDLYYYYSQTNDFDKATLFKDKATLFEDWCPIVKGKLHNYIDKEYQFVMKKNWILFYLEYWTYDLLY